MKNVSFRVIIFYAVAVVFIAAMVLTANGSFDGVWQLMQIVRGIICIAGVANFDRNRKKAAWFVIAGLLIAFCGGIATAIIYALMLALMMVICNNALRKELDVMCKE